MLSGKWSDAYSVIAWTGDVGVAETNSSTPRLRVALMPTDERASTGGS